MKRIVLFLLGCTEISVSCGAEIPMLNLLHQLKIPFLPCGMRKDSMCFRIYMRHEKRLSAALSETQRLYTVLRRFGIPVLFSGYRHRAGMLAGAVIFTGMLLLAPKFIWEVNYSGLKGLSQAEAGRILQEEGIYVGRFAPTIDRESVHANILIKNDKISWVSVNIRGSRANVEIVEREAEDAVSVKADGANVLAAKAGQILDMKITEGRRVAEVGTVIPKGGLLVSGVYDTGKMGTRFVCADAVVYAQVTDVFYEEIPLTYTERRYETEKTVEKAVKIFGKVINIFKNYSNIQHNYDILYRRESIPWAGFDRLPLCLESTVAYPYTEQQRQRTEAEALVFAKANVQKRIADARYKELLAKEEIYTVENGVLCYRCRVEAVQNIAMVSPFSID